MSRTAVAGLVSPLKLVDIPTSPLRRPYSARMPALAERDGEASPKPISQMEKGARTASRAGDSEAGHRPSHGGSVGGRLSTRGMRRRACLPLLAARVGNLRKSDTVDTLVDVRLKYRVEAFEEGLAECPPCSAMLVRPCRLVALSAYFFVLGSMRPRYRKTPFSSPAGIQNSGGAHFTTTPFPNVNVKDFDFHNLLVSAFERVLRS